MLKLEVLPAAKGDCLILHYGSEASPRLGLIDGGPSGVYKAQLRPRLQKLVQERGNNGTLDLDFAMVSHVDDDHINGILALARELADDVARGKQPFVRPLSFWHNSFDDLIGNNEVGAGGGPAQYGAASFAAEGFRLDEELDEKALKVLASVSQGDQLKDKADYLDWPINPEFGGGIAWAPVDAQTVVDLETGITATVVGPLEAEVLALQKAYDAWLKTRQTKDKIPASLVASYSDTSVPNLSSIVVVVAEERGRSMLLTGDARGDKVLTGLENAGFIQPGGGRCFDLIKVPHHGSDRNMEQDFFGRLHADCYVFSGNGEHGNPERATLEMLFAARPEGGYKLVFTYPLATIDTGRAAEAAKHHKPFVTATHGLQSLFEASLPPGVEIVALDGKPGIF